MTSEERALLEAWWAAGDDERAPLPEDPPWARAIAEATRAEVRFDAAGAERLLESARSAIPEGPWRRVWTLVSLRVEVRRARHAQLEERVSAIGALIDQCDAEAESATRGRAAHLLGVCLTRLARLEQAQRVLVSALDYADEGTRVRILDSLAVVWQVEGAWEEARRTFRAVAELKRSAGDVIGVAISEGSRARLALQQGEPEEAYAIAREVLAAYEAELPAMTCVRLQTAALEAALALGERAAVHEEAERLRRFVERASESHYLSGYAGLALARAADLDGDTQARSAFFDHAAACFTLPAQRALLEVWRARLSPDAERGPDWFEKIAALLPREAATEAEIEALLLRAGERARRTELDGMHEDLARAAERAASGNHPGWVQRVDEVADRLDPAGYPERLARRFTGRSLSEASRTRRERVTIVFVDLVGFTPRSRSLEPEEVMTTVRSLFELTTPLLTRHRVQPLTYLGDGLLAVAQGEGHERRALRFTIELIERARIATRVRAALGEPWGLDLRGGVASGDVVLGMLGSYLKREFSAIGLTTNLAARLQGQAGELEVVCTREVAQAAGVDGDVESLALKGFSDQRVDAVRIRIGDR